MAIDLTAAKGILKELETESTILDGQLIVKNPHGRIEITEDGYVKVYDYNYDTPFEWDKTITLDDVDDVVLTILDDFKPENQGTEGAEKDNADSDSEGEKTIFLDGFDEDDIPVKWEIITRRNFTATKDCYGSYVVCIGYTDSKGRWNQPDSTIFLETEQARDELVNVAIDMINDSGYFSSEAAWEIIDGDDLAQNDVSENAGVSSNMTAAKSKVRDMLATIKDLGYDEDDALGFYDYVKDFTTGTWTAMDWAEVREFIDQSIENPSDYDTIIEKWELVNDRITGSDGDTSNEEVTEGA